MHRGTMRRGRLAVLAAVMLTASVWAVLVQSASGYADPAFETQWRAGEAITPNFWGPLANAKDRQMEPYGGAMRLVQYFDKGRMELTGGTVTNGLLATELVRGQVQTGDATAEPKAPPAIPIAGDPDNPGPTYAGLAKATTLFATTTKQTGGVTARVAATGDVTTGPAGSGPTGFTAYDDATKHNLPQAFADYRTKAGVPAIGLAISEPFLTTVKVAGMPKEVMAQVFERRVLTYTASNPAAFQVEMGNIGQHYSQWRTTPVATTAATVAPTGATTPATTPGTTVATTPGATTAAARTTTAATGTSGTARASVIAATELPTGSTLITPASIPSPPAGITGSGAQGTTTAATVSTVNTVGKTPAVVCTSTDGRRFTCK